MAQVNIPLAALAPWLVVASVAYGFRTLKAAALEIELSCPVTPVQTVLGRALVILCYHLLLGLGLSLLVGGPAATALLGWCAALVLFAGLMLALTVFVGTAPAAVVTLMVWGGQLLVRRHWFSLFALPGTVQWPVVQWGAMAAGIGLLALAVSGPGFRRLLPWGNS